MSRLGQYNNITTRKKVPHRIEPFLRNKEVFLDLGDQNLNVKRQLTKLGCKVLTLPNNLTRATSLFISMWPLQHYTRKRLSGLPVDLLLKHSRGGRALEMMQSLKSSSSRPTSLSSLSKAQALNPRIQYHYYKDIKERLDREVKLNHPHEYRFEFDMSAIKSRYPDACQYFITDAKGVHKIEPHIIIEPPKLYLDHPCDHQGSYFAKPKREVNNKRRHSRLDIKLKVPKKRKTRLCDGCLRRYTDLDLHNKSKEHQEWYKATSFDDVDEFIAMVQKATEEEERPRKELRSPSVQNVKPNVDAPNMKFVDKKIDHVALPAQAAKEKKANPRHYSFLSSVSGQAKAKTGSLTNFADPSYKISEREHERSFSTQISSLSQFTSTTTEQNTTSTYSSKSFTALLSSNETKVLSRNQKKRKRECEQAISPIQKIPPNVGKVAVSTNSAYATSELQSSKPPFAPYQSTLQPRIIDALRIREYSKTRSAKRKKRKEVNEVLYRISGATKLKPEDKRIKLHQNLRHVAKKANDRLKPTKETSTMTFSKPVATSNSKNKRRSCLTYKQEPLRKKPKQHKHTGRLTSEIERLSKKMVVVKRHKGKSSKKKRVRHIPKEGTTVKKINKIKARRSSRIKTLNEFKSRKESCEANGTI